MTSRSGMKTQEFLRQLPDLVRSQLPQDMKGFQTLGPIASLIKIHYGQPSIHYEVWIQRRTGRIELGLHFEADPETNRRHLEMLSSRFFEIQAGLGPEVEPEQWTKSWTRIHQSLPLEALEEAYLEKVAAKLALMIRVLQPLVQEKV